MLIVPTSLGIKRPKSFEFENDQILEAIHAADLDKNKFWRLLKSARNGTSSKVNAIKNRDGKVTHEINEVLEIWKCHFESLGIPKNSPHFDSEYMIE